MKVYGHWSELPNDLSHVLKESKDDSLMAIDLIYLHEDGLTTQLFITKDGYEENKTTE